MSENVCCKTKILSVGAIFVRISVLIFPLGGLTSSARLWYNPPMEKFELNDIDQALIKAALSVLQENFDDGVYHHTVGCAVLCGGGRVYKGVNCDGIHGSCAEYITMGIAISAGERQFDTIVAVHEKAHNCVIPPCGNCRQMLYGYCPEIKVIVNDESGKLVKVKAKDLLPFAWTPIVC